MKRIERNGATGRTSAPQRCVLVVDDEVDILELIELTLLRMGLDVDRAMSVADAGEKLANGRHYDLCLTDMRLPDGTGLEIVEQIQKAELDIPVAVITAHGNTENAVAALKAGAFDYVSKPVSLDQLRTLVKSALSLPKVTDGKMIEMTAAVSPLRRSITAQEVADTTVFLCSPMSSGITGDVLYVDAGYHAMSPAPF